jgi:hypothetical protein
VPPSELAATGGRGVRWDGEFATWDELLALGRGLTGLVGPGRAFVVDPSAGIAAMAALFAVASMPDVTLLWAAVDTLGVPHRELAPGLHEVEPPVTEHVGRPLWGVCTSGSSGRPKVAIGHADLWELVALHYQRAMYDDALPGGPPDVLATNLPLQFSAAFFMTVLPSMFLRHDLVVFPAHDWTPVHEAARERNVAVLTVPAMATAACLAASGTADMSRVALFLGPASPGSRSRTCTARRKPVPSRWTGRQGTTSTWAIRSPARPCGWRAPTNAGSAAWPPRVRTAAGTSGGRAKG